MSFLGRTGQYVAGAKAVSQVHEPASTPHAIQTFCKTDSDMATLQQQRLVCDLHTLPNLQTQPRHAEPNITQPYEQLTLMMLLLLKTCLGYQLEAKRPQS